MAWGSKRSGGGGVAWLALLVALAALFLSWKAYQRTGGDLDDILHAPLGEVGEMGEAEETVDRETDLAEARARLLQRRAEVAAERNLRQIQEDVAEMRQGLERSFRDAGEEARRGWRDVDAELERLEAQLREGGARAVETLDSAVERMREIGEGG
jgi:hypothetical protein